MSIKQLTVEELLFNDEPIVINRKLAKCLGLKEAVIFQQVHYWLNINKKTQKNFKENRYWTFNSIKKWQESEFDFMSVRTVERTFQKLEKDGLLISKTFNKMKGDKTKWYSIDYEKLLAVCEKKLSEKEILSQKRKAFGKLGAKAKASKKAISEDIEENKINTPSNQLGNMDPIQPTWQNDITNLAEPIPETTTKISITSSSSSSKEEVKECENHTSKNIDEINALTKMFGESICQLKKTTLPKFINYAKNYDSEFIKAVIEYSEEAGAKSFKWFETTIETYIEKEITTKEAFLKSIEEHRANNKKKTSTKEGKTYTPKKSSYANKEALGLGFNNFAARNYDYEAEERKLLGWDKEDLEEKEYDFSAYGIGSALHKN